jgi:hypothetical protein
MRGAHGGDVPWEDNMPDTRYFDAIAQNLAEGMGAPGGSLESIVDQLRRTAQDVARALRPWTRHHITCSLVTHADVCDCGLDDELDKYVR